MPTENELRRMKVFKVTSYLILFAGIMMSLPYPLFYLIKLVLRAIGTEMFAPGHAFMAFLVAGQLVLCSPLLFIAFFAIWVWRETDNPSERFHAVIGGYFRYLPALILSGLAWLYTGRTGNAYILGIYGVFLIVYACIMLKIDSRGAEVKPG